MNLAGNEFSYPVNQYCVILLTQKFTNATNLHSLAKIEILEIKLSEMAMDFVKNHHNPKLLLIKECIFKVAGVKIMADMRQIFLNFNAANLAKLLKIGIEYMGLTVFCSLDILIDSCFSRQYLLF